LVLSWVLALISVLCWAIALIPVSVARRCAAIAATLALVAIAALLGHLLGWNLWRVAFGGLLGFGCLFARWQYQVIQDVNDYEFAGARPLIRNRWFFGVSSPIFVAIYRAKMARRDSRSQFLPSVYGRGG
jgi:hypothetical protein